MLLVNKQTSLWSCLEKSGHTVHGSDFTTEDVLSDPLETPNKREKTEDSSEEYAKEDCNEPISRKFVV